MIYFIILLAVASRLVPHMANFAPITALAIFSGANLSKTKAVAITLASRLISDLIIGFYSWKMMLVVYAAHLVGVLFGLWIKQAQIKHNSTPWVRVGAASLFSALIFFITTNFAYLYKAYPHNWSGILLSYTNGLPYLRGTLLGDIAYTLALFGAYAFAKALQHNLAIKKGSSY